MVGRRVPWTWRWLSKRTQHHCSPISAFHFRASQPKWYCILIVSWLLSPSGRARTRLMIFTEAFRCSEHGDWAQIQSLSSPTKSLNLSAMALLSKYWIRRKSTQWVFQQETWLCGLGWGDGKTQHNYIWWGGWFISPWWNGNAMRLSCFLIDIHAHTVCRYIIAVATAQSAVIMQRMSYC